MAEELGAGKAPNGVAGKFTDEDGLFVVRDEKGVKLTHSDTLEGLDKAGFKMDKKPDPKKPDPKKEPKKK